MQSHLIAIKNDLFDIAARLTSVKSTYLVYYNAQKQRYEVYDGDSFAFAVPYDELDCRTIYYARKTSVQNADKIFAEIDRNNDNVTKQIIQDVADKAMCKLNSRRKYDS